MNAALRGTLLVLALSILCGCAQSKRSYTTSEPTALKQPQSERMLIWKADLNVEVNNVPEAAKQATALTEAKGGYIEDQSSHGDDSQASLTLRIPSKAFRPALAEFEKLGKLKYSRVSGEDVTEKYVDVEARLKNKIALRDKLKALLEKAANVADIVAIEKELNDVQGEIDSMQGQMKSMKGKADYSTIELSLTRKPILGPAGYIFSGISWVCQKLFFIRQ